ncbi:MAG: hypothetical protein C0518_06385 [Opitutus sp.]|nr:hypothetical protein [Opitutus sp.]
MRLPRAFTLGWLLAGLALTALAFEVGGSAWTKRAETVLRAEPRALAPAAGKLGYGRKVKILEAKDGWLRVSEGGTEGWVFGGNLAPVKPVESKGMDGAPMFASQTNATAAARPLAPAANDYAASRNLGQARADLDWLRAQNAAVTSAAVEEFMTEQKKGEYQR